MESDRGAVLAQLRIGVTDYCVLAELRDGRTDGYEAARRLEAYGNVLGPITTLYAVLARLHQRNWVEVEWETAPAGPPRKYYALTDPGRRALDNFMGVWTIFSATVDEIIAQGDHHDRQNADD